MLFSEQWACEYKTNWSLLRWNLVGVFGRQGNSPFSGSPVALLITPPCIRVRARCPLRPIKKLPHDVIYWQPMKMGEHVCFKNYSSLYSLLTWVIPLQVEKPLLILCLKPNDFKKQIFSPSFLLTWCTPQALKNVVSLWRVIHGQNCPVYADM